MLYCTWFNPLWSAKIMSSNSVQGQRSNPAEQYFFKVETQTRRRGFLWLKKVQVNVLVLYKKDLNGTPSKVDGVGRKGIRILDDSKTDGRTLYEKSKPNIASAIAHGPLQYLATPFSTNSRNPKDYLEYIGQKNIDVSLQSLKGYVRKMAVSQQQKNDILSAINTNQKSKSPIQLASIINAFAPQQLSAQNPVPNQNITTSKETRYNYQLYHHGHGSVLSENSTQDSTPVIGAPGSHVIGGAPGSHEEPIPFSTHNNGTSPEGESVNESTSQKSEESEYGDFAHNNDPHLDRDENRTKASPSPTFPKPTPAQPDDGINFNVRGSLSQAASPTHSQSFAENLLQNQPRINNRVAEKDDNDEVMFLMDEDLPVVEKECQRAMAKFKPEPDAVYAKKQQMLRELKDAEFACARKEDEIDKINKKLRLLQFELNHSYSEKSRNDLEEKLNPLIQEKKRIERDLEPLRDRLNALERKYYDYLKKHPNPNPINVIGRYRL